MSSMRCSWLCGISRSFLLLSPAQGQVTYVLLTRSPLIFRRRFVRLACIRHAASVHPEPGSNSPFDLTLFYTLSSVILLKFIDVVLFLFVSQRTTRALSALANALIYNAIFREALQVFFSLFLKFFYSKIMLLYVIYHVLLKDIVFLSKFHKP